MKKIKDLLNNKYDNHIMPFLWMHGESEEKIREYMAVIEKSDIKSVCIESRPHEEFLQDKWWQDVSTIIDECEKKDMTVWILDDKHFPTGYAAGEIQRNHNKLQKEFLDITRLDFVGPKMNAGIILDWVTAPYRPNIMNGNEETGVYDHSESYESEIVTVVAAKKSGDKEIIEDTLIDLSSFVKNKTLYWDMPEGEWSIFILYTTQEGGENATEGYLNPLIPEATDILIETVYQSHFDHFEEKFGSVIKGFFSDEPRFGNTKGPDAIIGKVEMPLPWVKGLQHKFAKRMNISLEETLLKLVLLFVGESKSAHEIRYEYMEMITDMYSENFSQRIGTWCKRHNVEYIGHVIEDNNAHSRLGYGAGHFFKSMKGQDMAGIDVVLHQLAPQQNNGYFHSFTTTGWDGEFFHYTLGKLGASLGNLDERKKGRTMCELFGAYGWAEGIKMMKWMADHMLVRGINYFVPHAFTMKDFPDPDCPPHFFSNGFNPQFKHFHLLMTYMNRISTIFSDGNHKSDIAVYYNAEAEWSGDSMTIQKVTRALLENQYEFDIISSDMIDKSMILSSNEFVINKHRFKVLIIPYSERLPERVIKKIVSLMKKGIKVIFINDIMKEASDKKDVDSEIHLIKSKAEICNLNDLIKNLESKNIFDSLMTNERFSFLRYFHYEQAGKSVYMLFNENTSEDISISFKLPKRKNVKLYDPILNEVKEVIEENDWISLELSRAETVILFEGDEDIHTSSKVKKKYVNNINLNFHNWKISFDNGELNECFYANELPLLGIGDRFEKYSGTVLYETIIEGRKTEAILEIENASEVVTVHVNDEVIGTRISNPYRFDLSNKLENESSILKIEVTNNLGRKMRDYLSQYTLLDPIGITGSVSINHC